MIALLATALAAPVCGTSGRPTGPASIDLRPAGFGSVADPCPRTEVGVRGGGGLLVDQDDFYGRLQAFGSVDLRLRIGRGAELYGRMEPVRYDQVVAPVSVDTTEMGASTLGLRARLENDGSLVISAHGQMLLPTRPGVNTRQAGVDVGLTAARSTPHGDLHGGAVVLGQVSLGSGGGNERVALAARFGATRHLSERTSVVLDLPVSIGFAGGLDHLGLAGAVRMGWGRASAAGARGPFAELAAFTPVLGDDRRLVAGNLRIGYRGR